MHVLHTAVQGDFCRPASYAFSLFLCMVDRCLPCFEEHHHGSFQEAREDNGFTPGGSKNRKGVISSLSPFLYSNHPRANFLMSVKMRNDVGSKIFKCYLIPPQFG